MAMTAEQQRELALAEARAAMATAGQSPDASADAPWYQDAATAAGDILRIGSNAVTLGFRDKLAPMLTGRSVEEERAMTQEARERAGTAGLATELGGGMVLPGGVAKAGLSLAAAPAVKSMSGFKGLLARSGLMGLEGEALSSATAAGNDQEYQPGIGMAAGIGGSLLGKGISAGVGKIAGAFNKSPARLTVGDLETAKTAAYNASEAAGVIIKPAGVQSLSSKVRNDLATFGYHPKLQPGAATVFDEIEKLQGQNVTLKGLDTVRKLAGNAYIPGNKSNNNAVSQIVQRIDEMIDSNDPNLMAGLNTTQGIKALQEARKLAHNARKLDTVEKLAAKGARIGGRQKNQDVAGATRRQLQTILDTEAKGRGFTKAEKSALEKASGFTLGQRALDAASGVAPMGRLSGGAHGLLAATNVLSGNIPGLMGQGAAAAGGFAAHRAAEALAKKSVNEFVDLVARGGVPAPVVQSAMQQLAASKRDAITRGLMAIGVQQGVAAGR